MRRLAIRIPGILLGSDPSKLAAWLVNAHHAGVHGIRHVVLFVRRDIEAVHDAITETWSKGQTERRINRVKTLKR